MNQLSTFLKLLILFTLPLNLFADASPKLHDRLQIEFWENQNRVANFDSIWVLTELNDGQNTREILSLLPPKSYSDNSFTVYQSLFRIIAKKDVKTFQIFIRYKQKTYQSEQIRHWSGNSFYKFRFSENGQLENVTPLFSIRWIDYFKSLFLTVFLELLFISFFYVALSKHFSAYALFTLSVNLVSHPLLWLLSSHSNISIFYLELFVFLFEAGILLWFFAGKIRTVKIITITFFANIFSWLVGGLIFLIIS